MKAARSLWRGLAVLGAARDLTREIKTWRWAAHGPVTFFIDAEYADIRIDRHEGIEILATVKLGAAFAWTLAQEQDEAGVYLVARRKAIIGHISRADFHITLPPGAHISLKLLHCRLCLVGFPRALELPPGEAS